MKKYCYFLCWLFFIVSCIAIRAQTVATPLNIGKHFFPVGKRGCLHGINMWTNHEDCQRSDSTCYKIEFKIVANCNETWSEVYWTNKKTTREEPNWGQYPGSNLSKKGYTKITFWARGEKGRETIEFGSGGIDEKQNGYKYKDSYKAYSTDGYNIILTKYWKQYTIDLKNIKLSSVIGGFYWRATLNDNRDGATFYLDDIQFE